MLQLITPPTAEPLYLAEARQHLREPDVSDDPYILALIAAARQLAEHETGRQLMSATYDLHLDDWPTSDNIRLPRPPVTAVTHVKYYDEDGVLQTLSTAGYHVDTVSEPARIVLVDGESWPTLQTRPNAVVVRFVAGYADAFNVPAETATTVPASIRQWMLLHIGTWFEERQSVVAGVSLAVLPELGGLLDPWRVYALP